MVIKKALLVRKVGSASSSPPSIFDMSIFNSRPWQILMLVLLNGFTMSSLIIIWPERFILAMVFINSMLVCVAIIGILLRVQQLLAGNFGIKVIAIVFLLLQCCDFLDSLTAPKPRNRLYSSSPWYIAWIFTTVLVTILELRIMVGIWCDMCSREEERKKPSLPPSYSVCVIEQGANELPPPTYDEALKLKAATEQLTAMEVIAEAQITPQSSERSSNQVVLRCEALNERTDSRHSM
ncbi:hypothetical protein L596_001774 [Steinernema carpocapsae]|uniref:Uncharacterized protein n=1 Tax=Steinernema carpocapsae TaxID=34508 RepID=A0A4U8UR39_STECR|nr:hypothetical protein L596_001774 [Steinernema carpocapsae]